MKKILVTGALGFIGYHLTERLIKEGYDVFGLDNINAYYDVRLKYAKLPILGIEEENPWPNIAFQSSKHPNFRFAKIDLKDRFQIEELLRKEKFNIVVNLAAQAGVQYSIQNPHTYIENNITSFINLLDAAKTNQVKHFIYASSSSVYGNREDVPFKETDNVDHPISLYAASKKANELMAHTYSYLYNLKTTGLRFFTVYGPWGRPDMAPYIFVDKISKGEPITVFNKGNMVRDFTYVDDIVDGVSKVLSGSKSDYTYKIFNIGNSIPVNLMDFIHTIENILEKKAKIQFNEMREGDVIQTYSDCNALKDETGYLRKIKIDEGLNSFIEWYNIYIKSD